MQTQLCILKRCFPYQHPAHGETRTTSVSLPANPKLPSLDYDLPPCARCTEIYFHLLGKSKELQQAVLNGTGGKALCFLSPYPARQEQLISSPGTSSAAPSSLCHTLDLLTPLPTPVHPGASTSSPEGFPCSPRPRESALPKISQICPR